MGVFYRPKVQGFIHLYRYRNCPLGQDAVLWRIGTRRPYASSKVVVVEWDGFCRFSLHVHDSMDFLHEGPEGYWGSQVIARRSFSDVRLLVILREDSNYTTYAICKQAPGQARALCERSLLPKFNASEAEFRHLRCFDKLPPDRNTVAEQDFAFQTIHGKCRILWTLQWHSFESLTSK